MKHIDLNNLVLAADGTPYQFVVQTGKNEDGSPRAASHAATLREMIEWLIGRLPLQGLTMADAEHGTRIIQGLKGDGSFEDADFDWLTAKVIEYAPQIYSVNAYNFKLALEPRQDVSANGSTPNRGARRQAARAKP